VLKKHLLDISLSRYFERTRKPCLPAGRE